MPNYDTKMSQKMEKTIREVKEHAAKIITEQEKIKEKAINEADKRTKKDQLLYISKVRSRIADHTKNTEDHEIKHEDHTLLDEAKNYLEEKELVSMERKVGEGVGARKCKLLITEPYSHTAYAWAKMLKPADNDKEPDFITLMVPESFEKKVLVDTFSGVTIALGSDYIGEAKKSFLRQWMRDIKDKDMGLGLHAGSKIININKNGENKKIGQIFMGLSATGKSTLTGHGLGLEGNESAKLVQDDVGALLNNGEFIGTEGKGLFVKTEDLKKEEQPEIYKAVTNQKAILENVWANNNRIDFFNDFLTSNGRSVIQRSDMDVTENINLDEVDQLFFLTRNGLIPALSKLSEEHAAAFFMLGESIQTSAGDPSKAGQAIRVVGTNPFITGSKGEEGNVFYEILNKNSEIETFLLNTGHVGKKGTQDMKNIKLSDTIKILKNLIKNDIEYEKDDQWGYRIPKQIPNVNRKLFHPEIFYEQDYNQEVEKLRKDRLEHLRKFPKLKDKIMESLK